MGYRSLRECVEDLQRHGHLLRIEEPVDARLEAAAIHRRVYAAGGPALYFANVKNCQFPMVSNLFGTLERSRFMFRDTLERVKRMVELKVDPMEALKRPWHYAGVPLGAWTMRPKRVTRAPVGEATTSISKLPQLVSWPGDGGGFVTLPQVYTEDVGRPGWSQSNLGMYRIQLTGGAYQPDEEIGLHYQLHRSIGVHHRTAIESGKPFRVNIFVGGTPAMNLAAVMPLPEGMSELTFAGALAGHRIRMWDRGEGLPIDADTDFCICGTVVPDAMKPEGPFGDHLGYYSLRHDFPVLRIEHVYHRQGAIWPFTVVGRPPQEDTSFGALIHELTGPAIPAVLPGVKEVHAVDAAGVHPLLLAIGSERYMPFLPEAGPQELLTQAHAILGQGQLSLAKYLLIANRFDDDQLDLHDIGIFFRHLLERADWQRDIHFQNNTTIDTLDYSGEGLNRGSKVIIAASGPKRFELATEVPENLRLPDGFKNPLLVLPGILSVEGPTCPTPQFDGGRSLEQRNSALATRSEQIAVLTNSLSPDAKVRLIVVVDDSRFLAESLNNFLWVTFTRSNPATDIYGVDASVAKKQWICRGPLVIDARLKPHHAPPLEEDRETTRRVEALAAPGGPLHGVY